MSVTGEPDRTPGGGPQKVGGRTRRSHARTLCQYRLSGGVGVSRADGRAADRHSIFAVGNDDPFTRLCCLLGYPVLAPPLLGEHTDAVLERPAWHQRWPI